MRRRVTPDPPPVPAPEWARVKEVFLRALDQPPEHRRTWVESAAIGDPVLHREVNALLAAHETAHDFLERPPIIDPGDLHGFPPGTELGTYTILAELGRGGGGIVYLAEDRGLRRHVALKLVADGADPELRDRLRREARAAATITHPSVATIYALEEVDSQLFIVSEYVRGHTLRATLADGPLPRERALAIARDIAHALRAAHQAGVIHRDLKPENVLLSDSGSVKVVDFGIARVTGEGVTQLTQRGALLGTPAYMAPEQLLGTPADARADIYAFGIVLSEMLAGRHPGVSAASTPAAAEGDDLTAIVRQCTELDPAARIQTADRLVAMLEEVHTGHVRIRTTARWWWEFHQVAAAIVYSLALWPAWLARVGIGGPLGRTLFIGTVAAVIVTASLRFHLWFTSRFYPAELGWVRARAAPWIAVGDTLFTLSLVSGGLLIRQEDSSVGLVLLSIGLGAAVAFLMIEAATARAAFRARH